MAYLYRHIRLDTNKPFYIGIAENTDGYYKRAFNKSKRSEHWKRITQKTNYRVDIVFDEITWEEAIEKEIEFIKLYGRINANNGFLCNQTDGGEGTVGKKLTHEQRMAMKGKLGKWMTGRKRSEETILKFKNRVCTPETRKKLSLAGSNRKHSPETIQKMRMSQIKSHLSEDIKRKISTTIKNKSAEEKQLIKDKQYPSKHPFFVDVFLIQNNEYLGEFSVPDAAKKFMISKSTIFRFIDGKTKNPLKYRFIVTKRI